MWDLNPREDSKKETTISNLQTHDLWIRRHFQFVYCVNVAICFCEALWPQNLIRLTYRLNPDKSIASVVHSRKNSVQEHR